MKFGFLVLKIEIECEFLIDTNKEKESKKNNLTWRNIVYLRTWGCSHNNSDSEYMDGLLLKAGY